MSSRGGAVGIDIGGTKIAVAAVDESGDVLWEGGPLGAKPARTGDR